MGGALLFWLALFSTDTEYAPDFAERNFKAIQEGDTRERVLELIGEPLSRGELTPSTEWLYTPPGHPGRNPDDGGLSGTFSQIQFDENGIVISAFGQTQTGSSEGLISSTATLELDGGPLGLSSVFSGPNPLEGKTIDEIEALYGRPTFEYVDSATMRFQYSRSPSGGNYKWRSVDFDANGRVTGKRSFFYWD